MQKLLIYVIYRIGTNIHKFALAAVLLAIAGLILWSTAWVHQISDTDRKKSIAIVAADVFGDRYDKVEYLDQGWRESDSLWFYNITQGSNLLPYDFFIALEEANSTAPFRSDENMNRLRYLPQRATSSNPDGLPVGMVADMYQGKKYMGFTCAACHTGQINFKGTGIRIDGGPAAADMDAFMSELAASLTATENESAKFGRFAEAILKRGNYRSKEDIRRDLEAYALRTRTYNFINASPGTRYGYARLDAFGRIYNRVLQHVLTEKELLNVLKNAKPESGLPKVAAEFAAMVAGDNRDHIIERLWQLLTDEQRELVRLTLFNRADAPVSYPFLWDIPHHDYVQWNGIAANAGVGPIGRNAGEVMGVFATLDWAEKDGWSVSSAIGGQGFGKTHIKYKSSVDLHNLVLIESKLISLQSPSWPSNILPPLNGERIERGGRLFDQHCVKCHEEMDRTDPNRRIVAQMIKLDAIGTDRKMSENSVQDMGLSGIVRNQYGNTSVGNILLKERAPVASILTKATENVVATPDPDKYFFQRWANWVHEIVNAYFENEIKPSVKTGSYDPDMTVSPFASLGAYKGRSLNGIWATAPYLHNGSVPTLYDLLLPARKMPGDPVDTKYRPETFMVGSREFDPEKVGLKSAGYNGFLFDTTMPGNGNAGHEYGTRLINDNKDKEGKILRPLSEEDRLDLLEYLKSL